MNINHFSPVRWALAFLLPAFFFIIGPTVLYTYLVDPLWQWDHSHHLERWHSGFNERLQKTNYLASRNMNIDTLILGSSRSTYFRTEWLGTENGFNYAVNGGNVTEFVNYIDYAKAQSDISVNLIMVEASESSPIGRGGSSSEPPSFYIENAKDGNKKTKNLFNVSALGYALAARKSPAYGYYFVNSFGEPEYKSADMDYAHLLRKQSIINAQLKAFKENIYSNRSYNEAYSKYLSEIHNAAGNAELVVFTMPLAWQLMKLYAEMGHLDDYERWLRELVAEFGKVYHFFYPNPIVMDNGYFNDIHHPSGEAAELIMGIIMRLRSGEIVEDTEHGGILLTNENIEEWLPVFREKMEGLVDISF